jgi:CDGSH-type Zn-finger protein
VTERSHGAGTGEGGRAEDARPRTPAGRVSITPYRDGPLVVRGPFELRGPDGLPIPARRRTVALCRCGRSSIAPFCDGTHRRVGFRAPGGPRPPASS